MSSKRTTKKAPPAKKSAAADLPVKLFGRWVKDPAIRADDYVRFEEDINDLVQTGEEVRVGIYELVGFATLKNRTMIELDATPAPVTDPPPPKKGGRR